jgi:N-acetylglucosaminyldiphosphoundecaprenol N-acetyl-beta-D-mannosaminyltransferase
MSHLQRKKAKQVTRKERDIKTILNVNIDSTSIPQVLSKIKNTIKTKQKCFIVTPNPEIVLQAHRDNKLREALNAADISIPDGIGIIKAENYLHSPKLSRVLPSFYGISKPTSELTLIKGRELFLEIIKLADDEQWKVVLLGDSKDSAQKAERNLIEKFKFKKIKLYSIKGPNLTLEGKPISTKDEEQEKYAINLINKIQPQVLFVGFGAPRQEKWLYKWQDTLRSRVDMVVGGTFNYISGKTPLPPVWWPNSLEWVWRLYTKPSHITRVWNAVIIFPYTIVKK